MFVSWVVSIAGGNREAFQWVGHRTGVLAISAMWADDPAPLCKVLWDLWKSSPEDCWCGSYQELQGVTMSCLLCVFQLLRPVYQEHNAAVGKCPFLTAPGSADSGALLPRQLLWHPPQWMGH